MKTAHNVLRTVNEPRLSPSSHSSALNAGSSQVEKKALAIAFAVRKFRKLVYGRKFTLNTDHKPLLAVFGSKNGIPARAANRFQRRAMILLEYQFDINQKGSTIFREADALSRLIADQSIHKLREQRTRRQRDRKDRTGQRELCRRKTSRTYQSQGRKSNYQQWMIRSRQDVRITSTALDRKFNVKIRFSLHTQENQN